MKKVVHINELYQPLKNSSNNINNQAKNNNIKRDASPTLNKNYSNININNYNKQNTNLSNNLPKNNNLELKNNNINNKYNDIIINNEEDLQRLSMVHENLINSILTEEEGFINYHRTHIDDMVELVKQEMMLINDVDKPGSDIDNYVCSLDKLFQEKAERIQNVRAKLFKFHKLLKEEEILAKKFSEYQNDMGDISPINNNDDFNQYK